VIFLDELHHLSDWAKRLKGHWDHLRRKRVPAHVVATGSSALDVTTGPRESLAGRLQCMTPEPLVCVVPRKRISFAGARARVAHRTFRLLSPSRTKRNVRYTLRSQDALSVKFTCCSPRKQTRLPGS